MELPENILACPFCGVAADDTQRIAYTSQADARGMCVCGAQGPSERFGRQWEAWNRRAGAGRASQDNGGKQLCSSAWLGRMAKRVARAAHGSCAPSAGSATVDALVADLESRGLGWSLDNTGRLIEARVWDWPYVIGRYRPNATEPLAKMLAEAMYQVDWKRYPVKSPNVTG